MNQHIDKHQNINSLPIARSFLELLHPCSEEGFLAITAFPGPRTYFHDLSLANVTAEAARRACGLVDNCDVYFAIGVQRHIPTHGRGAAAGVISIPAGWADIDYQHSVHASRMLPPDEDGARWIVTQFPLAPSILVSSGHGLQALWLMTQPWGIRTDEERSQAKHFSEKLQAVLRAAAAKRSWGLDNTSDLARLLRLPGTYNRKDTTDIKLVTYEDLGTRYDRNELVRAVNGSSTQAISMDPARPDVAGASGDGYNDGPTKETTQSNQGSSNVADGLLAGDRPPKPLQDGSVGSVGFGTGCALPAESDANRSNSAKNDDDHGSSEPNDKTGTASDHAGVEGPLAGASTRRSTLPLANIAPIVHGCAWMRHCRDDATILSEPEWYGTLTILANCKNGDNLAQAWSRPYPKYSQAETRKKLAHARRDSGPITCEYVSQRLGQMHLCAACRHWQAIRSPIVLGLPGRSLSLQEPWPNPQPLSAVLPDVAPFEPALFPDLLREFVVDVAERLQVPIDFSAATLLVALAGMVGRRAVITPMQHDKTWVVVPNLWGGLVGRPGLMKSACIQALLWPMQQLQSQAFAQYKADKEDYEREIEAWETRKAAANKAAKRDPAAGAFEEPKPDMPTCFRCVVNDTTIEKLHEILEQNPQGVFYVRDELAGWFADLDTKGRERERPFFLESWNGDGSYTIDRIGRGTIHVPHLCISLFGGIQPSRLQAYLAGALEGGASDDGLAQRLQILVWPDQSEEWRHVDRVVNHEAAIAVARLFDRIAHMPIIEPLRASFSPAAQELFNHWRAELENRIRREKMPPAVESHLAKYRSLMPSIAILLHLAEGDQAEQIPLRQAQRAAAWCEYLESHARRLYSCATALSQRLAAQLADKLKEGCLGQTFRVRDVYLKGWTNLDTPEAARMALSVLEDAGWVRRVDTKPGLRGGRPAEEYIINPAVYHV